MGRYNQREEEDKKKNEKKNWRYQKRKKHSPSYFT